MENAICDLGASVMPVVFDQAAQFGDLLRVSHFAELDHLLIDFGDESVCHVEDVRNTSTHPSRKITTCDAQDDNSAACHVLTPVITTALDDGMGPGIAHSESLGGNTANECLARRSAIKTNVSDDVLVGFEGGLLWMINNQPTTRQSFANIVV